MNAPFLDDIFYYFVCQALYCSVFLLYIYKDFITNKSYHYANKVIIWFILTLSSLQILNISLKFSIFEGSVAVKMHLKMPYLYGNYQDEGEYEDMQITIAYINLLLL